MNLGVSAIDFLRRSLAYPDWRGKALYALCRGILGAVPIRRKHVLEQLALCFPEKDAKWRKDTLRAIYRHYALMIVEFLAAVNDPSLVDKMFVEFEGREHIDRLRDEGKGAIILCAHLSNWEITAGWMARSDYPVIAAERDADDKSFAALINGYRSRLGDTTTKKGALNVRQMIRDAKNGHWIALLADQDAGRDAVPVTFFGRRTTMVEGPAALALTAKVPLLGIYPMRIAPFKYKLCIKPPLSDGTEGRTKENVFELTQKANAEIEQMVRLEPEQWFWFHRRWKNKPRGE